jgi:hypothetical protein
MPSISTSTSVTTFSAIALVKGKGVTASHKFSNALANGADVGALAHVGKHRKEILARMGHDGFGRVAHALSVGNIRPACAVLAEVSGNAVSLMEVDGRAPYSEFLRLGATLAALPAVGKTGKPTAAAKAHAIWAQYRDVAKTLRDARDARESTKKASEDDNLALAKLTEDVSEDVSENVSNNVTV